MKTGDVSRAGVLAQAQAKPTRESKVGGRKEPDKVTVDTVDLSATEIPVTSTPAPYEEVLELLYGIDYSKMKNVDWLSKDGIAKLTDLIQS